MIPFIPAPNVATNLLDMTGAIAPFSGAALVGLFLCSLAGIVVTVFLDRWHMRRQAKLVVAPAVNTVSLSKAA
jgi:hypothetical protein